MTHSHYWVALLLVALGTQIFRLVFLGTKRSPELPLILKRAMGYVPTAVLAALVVPQFVNLSNPDWTVIGAGLAAALSAWFFKMDILALGVGFLAYALISLIAG
jgi:branched-subunit amino acid transport protein